MKLLIITQKVDQNDPVLGFFHRWIVECAKYCESIVVVCLQKGAHELPANVRVLSLGKEEGKSRGQYILNFYRYMLKERRNYDAVFVHMNQEYILLAGCLWKMLGKRVYMWRNHYEGNLLTSLAVAWCTKVFCTSTYSFTAKYAKTVIMPVGIDTDVFRQDQSVQRVPRSVLFLGRIAPSKKPDLLIKALDILARKGVQYTATIVGDALPKDAPYLESLVEQVKSLGLQDRIIFTKGVSNDQTPSLYSSHEIFVNLSRAGMYDKTMFEAMSCGSILVAANADIKEHIDGRCVFIYDDTTDLAQKIASLLAMNPDSKELLRNKLRSVVVERHSLLDLGKKIIYEMDS